MVPRIGRIVHYKRHGSPNGQHKADYSPAIITAVHSDEIVSLCVFNPEGMYFNKSVTKGSEPGQWTWPVVEKAVSVSGTPENEHKLPVRPDVETRNIIGSRPLTDIEIADYERLTGLKFIGQFPATMYHPAAVGTDSISFWARPINEQEYIEYMDRLKKDDIGSAPGN